MTRMIQVRVVETDERGERTELRCWNIGYDARRRYWSGGDGVGPTRTHVRFETTLLDVGLEALGLYNDLLKNDIRGAE